MSGATYATGKPLPPRDQWVPRVWECGFCVHLGPINVGYGWLEVVAE